MWDAGGGTRVAGMGTSSSYTHFTAREVEAQRSGGTLTIWKSEMEPRLEPKFPEPWPPVFHHPKPAHTHLRFVNSTGCVLVFLHTVPERLLDMSDKRKRDREMQTQRDKERNTQRDKERQQE